MKYVIIGSGIAGVTAAETIKKEQPEAEVVLITDEEDFVYNKVVLPNYLKGRTERDRLFVRNSEEIQDNGINVFTSKVMSINTHSKKITLESGDHCKYDKALIATGGRPKQLPIPGGDLPYVYTFHTLADSDTLLEQVTKSSKVAVTGGGFISLELIDALQHRGIETHLFLRKKGFWLDVMDAEQSELITQHLKSEGIVIHQEEPIQEITTGSIKTAASLYAVDFVAYGIGLDFNIDFILNTDIQTNNGVRVNEYLQSSNPDVYAAGDVAEYYHPSFGRHSMTANWNHAILQGQVAALNMIGKETVFDDVTYYTMNVRGLFVATLGEIDPQFSDEIIVRKNDEQYVKILLKEDVIIGASFVEGIKDLMPIRKMIQEKVSHTQESKNALSSSSL